MSLSLPLSFSLSRSIHCVRWVQFNGFLMLRCMRSKTRKEWRVQERQKSPADKFVWSTVQWRLLPIMKALKQFQMNFSPLLFLSLSLSLSHAVCLSISKWSMPVWSWNSKKKYFNAINLTGTCIDYYNFAFVTSLLSFFQKSTEFNWSKAEITTGVKCHPLCRVHTPGTVNKERPYQTITHDKQLPQYLQRMLQQCKLITSLQKIDPQLRTVTTQLGINIRTQAIRWYFKHS